MLLSVSANELLTKRNGTVTITDGAALTFEIAVEQAGKPGSEQKLDIVSATASTEQTDQGNVAANLFDSDMTNRWSGQGDGAYVSFDLGSVQEISFVKIGLYKGNERSSTFDILLSEDGATYSPLLSNITTQLTEDTLVLYDTENTSARYVRLVGHGNTSSLWNSYTELEVWGFTSQELNEQETTTIAGVQQKAGAFFPNPCKGRFSLTDSDVLSIKIINALGMPVYQTQQTKGAIYINLPVGVYFMLMETRTGLSTNRLVVE